MCAGADEEQHRLLDLDGGGKSSATFEFEKVGSPSKDATLFTKQLASSAGWKRQLYILPLAAAAFAPGYFFNSSRLGEPVKIASYVDLLGSTPLWNQTIHSNDRLDGPLFNASFVDYLTYGMKAILASNNGTKKHYRYESPYEQRWPGSHLPKWARKTVPYNRRIPVDKQMCFVHVGKAGGSTVGCMLGFSIHCDNENEIKGLLPVITTHTFHRSVYDCPSDVGYYLFAVRDPLSRILSTVNYERPDMTEDDPFSREFHIEELYSECNFWTLEDLAQNGLLNKKHDPMSKKCRSRAYDAITGAGMYLRHSYCNYQYYSQFIFGTESNNKGSTVPENANLFVIRNTHIVDDWNSINELLGGPPGVLKPSDVPVNNAHEKNSKEMFLSDSSKAALCSVLCNEIQIYKDMISQSMNLNEDDVRQSMEELRQSCPKETDKSACLGHKLSMAERIKDNKEKLD